MNFGYEICDLRSSFQASSLQTQRRKSRYLTRRVGNFLITWCKCSRDENEINLSQELLTPLIPWVNPFRSKTGFSRQKYHISVDAEIAQPRSQGLSSLPPLSLFRWRQRRETLGTRLEIALF